MRIAVGITRDAPDDWESAASFAVEAERLGVHSIWSAEVWGHDALTPLAFLAGRTSTVRLGSGIIQVGSRTPALVAMTAMALNSISDGRFILGLGTSGPQVMEGWHGVSFDRPVTRTRELIEIVRLVTSGERVTYEGEIYQLPLPGGEGRALRTSATPTKVPIYVASLGPQNLRMTGELADGWIGNSFFPETAEVFLSHLRDGAKLSGRTLDHLDLQVAASVEFTDDIEEAAKRHARGFAFTFGAMGSANRNFYNNAFSRQGFADDVREVQRLWLDGKRDEARDRVPLEIALRANLLGTTAMVKDRLRAYRDAGIDTLRVGLAGSNIHERLDTLGRLMELVAEFNSDEQRQHAIRGQTTFPINDL